jgi:cyclic beta-1,2-glucan synthetase
MLDPAAAARNFVRLEEAGGRGAYGFYEALDYTGARVPEGTAVAVVRAYMAHHQGMLLVAIANALGDGRMRARFHAEPEIQAAELLLQERTPRDVAVARPRVDETAIATVRELVAPTVRRFTSPHSAVPQTHLLSNGRYAVMMTSVGSGYSRWQHLAITRWREDVTRDADGMAIFLRDAATGACWSAGYQPTGVTPDRYEVAFSEDRVEIARRDRSLATTLDVIVSPEDDVEIRRVTLTNLGSSLREIDVTSYAELALIEPAADAAHPAFAKLFVQTECVPELDALLATRRPRARDEAPVWLAHVMVVDGECRGGLSWETDRARFLGRGRDLRSAVAMDGGVPLSNTVGAVLDPIVSLRRRVVLRPGDTSRIVLSTLVAPSRDAAIALAEKYHDPATFDRATTLAWTQAQVQLRHLGISADEAHLFQSLASRILYSDRALRAPADVLARHEGGAAALWPHGISGDVPIVLVRIDETADVDIVRQLLRAHEYWRLKRLPVDLVILNDRAPSYTQDLHTLLETVLRTSQSSPSEHLHDANGGVFILRAERLTPPQHDVLHAAARALLSSRSGSLVEQLARAQRLPPPRPASPSRTTTMTPASSVAGGAPSLEFWNGVGGFDADGRDYVMVLSDGAPTPAPWINVISNPAFGFQVSESGSGYTWSGNSREHQLTPWSNDPVGDPPGEVLYVRDDDTDEVWTATALSTRDVRGSCVARHGQGWSRFERTAHEVELELLQFVPLDDTIKISRLRLTNRSTRTRRLTVTAYVEWVLGVSRSASAPFVVTEIDAATGAMFARNRFDAEFGHRVAFADLRGAQTAWTADRTEFLGRHGSVDRPAALEPRQVLSGRVGAGLDPCAALQTTIELRAGGHADVVFFLGDAAGRDEARALVTRSRRAGDVEQTLRAVVARWDDTLGAVQVTTPDRALDVMLNRWLLYQTLGCRIWARSAFYQAGGAWGFRDQLQDVMALLVTAPAIARAQIVAAAARQFVEGDVQHWWHPPTGRGVRTRISDDRLWLPYVVSRYLEVTGDTGLLGELVPFLDGAVLAPDVTEAYFAPRVSDEHATLFEHGARAIDRSLAVGAHGLPLIGTGDWNDGMNRVGVEGKGESVWLGFFLATVLADWSALADARGETLRAAAWRDHRRALTESLERDGWDGAWYRRAYFDDGTPLGASDNDACRIDSIAQSWSVISGVVAPPRARRAMDALDEHLVRRADGVMPLLTPPFGDTAFDPGYIKGYLPGVRENGGQYTHAAAWAVIAFAELGDGDRASELFRMLNPIAHALTPADVLRYKVEPYVVAGDVYAEAPHVGRGGWSWYTGSAGWLYRSGLEWILGFRLRGERLTIDPCIPCTWPGFTIVFRYGAARYEITVENPQSVMRGVVSLDVDGSPIDGRRGLPLLGDAKTYRVRVVLGADGYTRPISSAPTFST